MSDRLKTGIRLTEKDLVVGRTFVLQATPGFPEEHVAFQSIRPKMDDKGRTRLKAVFEKEGNQIEASLRAVLRGRIGRAAITGMENPGDVRLVNADGPVDTALEVKRSLGTDKVFIQPKGVDIPVPAIISKAEDDNIILVSPDRPDRQLFIADREALISGRGEDLKVTLVPENFGAIFRNPEEDEAPEISQKIMEIRSGQTGVPLPGKYTPPLQVQNPDPVADKMISDVKHNPVRPGDRCWLVATQIEAVSALYVGMALEDRAAKFIVEGGERTSEVVKIPVSLLNRAVGVVPYDDIILSNQF